MTFLTDTFSLSRGSKSFLVGYTGFEPVTSALSRQRSKPTELIPPNEGPKLIKLRSNSTKEHHNLEPSNSTSMKISKNIFAIIFLMSTSQLAFGQSEEYTLNKQKKLAEKSPFEKIVDRELPATIEYEDEEIIAFVPLKRQAPVHFLIVPKKRIPTMSDVTDQDVELLGRMMLVARDIARKNGITETGYRLIFNTNEDSGQSVFHIHLHLLGGKKLGPMLTQGYTDPEHRE